MNRGLYMAGIGMTTQMNKMNVVSNNIANASTIGYKKDNVVTRSFDEELLYRLNDEEVIGRFGTAKPIGNISLGLSVDEIYTDFSHGSTESTGNPFDVAIEGDGFFKILYTNKDGSQNIKYTKNGSFTTGADGTLLTKNGQIVLGADDEPILIPKNSNIAINEMGRIYSDGEFVNQLNITSFEDDRYLNKYGENFYDLTEGGIETQFVGSVTQGSVESSNVSSVEEMVQMISLSRAYETNSKMISAQDTLLNKAVNEVGRKS